MLAWPKVPEPRRKSSALLHCVLRHRQQSSHCTQTGTAACSIQSPSAAICVLMETQSASALSPDNVLLTFLLYHFQSCVHRGMRSHEPDSCQLGNATQPPFPTLQLPPTCAQSQRDPGQHRGPLSPSQPLPAMLLPSVYGRNHNYRHIVPVEAEQRKSYRQERMM